MVTGRDSNTGQEFYNHSGKVIGPDGNSINGGLKTADVYAPARDIYLDWFFGAEDSYDTLTVDAYTDSLWLEQSMINTSHRQFVIINGSTTNNYTYAYRFSRNGVGDSNDDFYIPTNGGATVVTNKKIIAVTIPSSSGWDQYMQLRIKPTAAQADLQLDFKVYLTGRGG